MIIFVHKILMSHLCLNLTGVVPESTLVASKGGK